MVANTRHPREARRTAVARPMPLDVPVISTDLMCCLNSLRPLTGPPNLKKPETKATIGSVASVPKILKIYTHPFLEAMEAQIEAFGLFSGTEHDALTRRGHRGTRAWGQLALRQSPLWSRERPSFAAG